MYPLRFPNNGIRAKVFMRKIYFKLRVMRLNRVELFYAFLLRFHNKRNEDGQLATAKPPARAANYGLATYKGATDYGQGPLHKGGKRLRHDHLQHGARRGDWLVGCPQRGHRGSAHSWPACRGAAPAACVGVAAVAAAQRGKRRRT
ncbi:hypothetical protein B296_00026432 [Ensete ventricosum]|uniref:Uncharacterized protein n=1 Tax=Ensete ventricosum TaxID=4639 RepID=A0A426Z765_ENSVE|nr:hypothetical protein B296_00026432 [Ensete ventricosum]